MTEIIVTEHLKMIYPNGVEAVKDLNIEVRKGEVFGFLGPNGAGKSTSLNMMVGLLKPTEGRTLIEGTEVKPWSRDVKEMIGIVPQDTIYWENLTTEENLMLLSDLHEIPREEGQSRAAKLLEDMQLTEKADHLAKELSGGMKRRLNLAMGLIHEPPVLLLDEPSPGLDPQTRRVLWDYISCLPAKGHTLILTTHDMDEADYLSDRVAIIDHGELLVLDTPHELKASVGEGDVLELAFEEGADLERAVLDFRKRDDVLSANITAGRVVIRIKDAMSHLPEIFQFVESHGSSVRDIRYRGNTLEDVFINLTGRALREVC
ncbi:MAG: ATP-binding cassette domain-containing protein [Thermoplasmata archaeon]|nr:MAG: ATP-binding cassette domain-containing protein [Thermoplasmata archaeon]